MVLRTTASAEELVSQHLIDLNAAGAEQIAELGMSAESLERLLEIVPIATSSNWYRGWSFAKTNTLQSKTECRLPELVNR